MSSSSTMSAEINTSARPIGDKPDVNRQETVSDLTRDPLTTFAGPMDHLLRLSGAATLVAACDQLSRALAEFSAPIAPSVPEGVRADLHRLAAVLSFPTWEEVVKWSAHLGADLRDLNEKELAHLEGISLKTVRQWRTSGTGPAYRNEAGIRYPSREVWEWRRKGRQTMTAQRVRRGRRRS